jgi:ribosomal-protein-alanine N-acetyltransferase
MAQFPAPLSRAESEFVLEQIEVGFDRDGFGIWAVETLADTTFLGLTGISPVPFAAAFTPAVEVGWRLLPAAWGHGYATEAARASLDFGFGSAGLDEIVSFASASNQRSIAVMKRLNMRHEPGQDFDHPLMEKGHPLAPHVIYRITASAWATQRPAAGRPTNPGSSPRR